MRTVLTRFGGPYARKARADAGKSGCWAMRSITLKGEKRRAAIVEMRKKNGGVASKKGELETRTSMKIDMAVLSMEAVSKQVFIPFK